MKQIFMYTGRFGKGQTLTMLEMKNGKRRFTLKYKLLFALAVVLFALLCFGCCEAVKAEAAEDEELSSITVNWCNGTTREFSMEGYSYYFYCSFPYDKSGVGECFLFLRSTTPIVGWKYSDGSLSFGSKGTFEFSSYIFDGVYVQRDDNKGPFVSGVLIGTPSDILYYSNCDILHKNTSAFILPSNPLPAQLSLTSVCVSVAGVDYTFSEPLPYYFVSYSDSEVEVAFSDVPLVGSYLDLYTRQLEALEDCTVVSYSWSSESNNNFLDSRMVYDSGYTLILNSDSDYMCNYTVSFRDNLLRVFLPEKNALDTPDYTASFLYSSLPEELRERKYIIIFRQDSPCAYDNRIIFYGWDDVNANLYINSSNSQISALKGRSALMDVSKAYYDEMLSEWVVSDDVILGATTDGSYHLPYIYFCDSDLFIADDEWYGTGTVAYMADLERPLVAFDEPVEDEDEGLLGSILNGFKKLLISLFVPSSGYFEKRVDEISLHFGFWTSVRDTANVFVDFLKETDFDEPPTVEIDLSVINSKVDYGGTAYAFDMRWYEPYKESVDVILSSILWLVFAWNTFKNLPNIISGVSSGLSATSSLLDERKE